VLYHYEVAFFTNNPKKGGAYRVKSTQHDQSSVSEKKSFPGLLQSVKGLRKLRSRFLPFIIQNLEKDYKIADILNN